METGDIKPVWKDIRFYLYFGIVMAFLTATVGFIVSDWSASVQRGKDIRNIHKQVALLDNSIASHREKVIAYENQIRRWNSVLKKVSLNRNITKIEIVKTRLNYDETVKYINGLPADSQLVLLSRNLAKERQVLR